MIISVCPIIKIEVQGVARAKASLLLAFENSVQNAPFFITILDYNILFSSTKITRKFT